MALPEIGEVGQSKIKNARVLIVGTGGLGSPAALYLAAAGIGCLGLMDADVVELSNLQRQTLFTTQSVGNAKVEEARKALLALNPEVEVIPYHERLSPERGAQLFEEYDVVLDGSDNFGTRYLVNDLAVTGRKPFISASVDRFSGLIGIFNYRDGPTYRCLFPDPPRPGERCSCAEGGVMGVVPGVLGIFQATEALKLILGLGSIASGRVLSVNLLTLEFTSLQVERWTEATSQSYLRTSEYYESLTTLTGVEHLSPRALEAILHGKKDHFALIDVREQFERQRYHLGGVHCPLEQSLISPLPSYQAPRIAHLSGGLTQWAKEGHSFL